jgi:hypothetical protein
MLYTQVFFVLSDLPCYIGAHRCLHAKKLAILQCQTFIHAIGSFRLILRVSFMLKDLPCYIVTVASMQ